MTFQTGILYTFLISRKLEYLSEVSYKFYSSKVTEQSTTNLHTIYSRISVWTVILSSNKSFENRTRQAIVINIQGTEILKHKLYMSEFPKCSYSLMSLFIHFDLVLHKNDVSSKIWEIERTCYQPEKSITNNDRSARQILQKILAFNIETHHLFIFFKATYDSVNRTPLYQ